ncbi:hypothetical protein L4X63_02210 [Geomonas sp. Red32]|nr:hypothetical protein [Geomonas sp. Red32]MCM0080393.1 hypothetical protein [Geomonas sp. Red32]
MVLGFNHNIGYKGEVFHVQTEDSGRANPHIITLLYRQGTIIASSKTSYADIIKVDQLETVVESIMKEQHKDMMRRLKSGEFDARIFGQAPQNAGEAPAATEAPAAGQAPAQAPAAKPEAASAAQPAAAQDKAAPHAHHAPHLTRSASAPAPSAGQGAAPGQTAASQPPAGARTAATPQQTTPSSSPSKRSLDEVILDYLITGEEK